jgi:hypothetical protein
MRTIAGNRSLAVFAIGSILASVAFPADAVAQTTSIKAEYLMTLYGTLKQQAINTGLRIIEVPSGWVEGPRIKGKLLPPSGDWYRNLPSGVGRVDVRLVIQTDDNQIIYASYNGIQQCSKEATERLVNNELVKGDECYFITAPTFETGSEKYSWLNAVQTIGKMIELKRGDHIKYDIFIIK